MDTKDKFRQLPSRNDNPEYYERITEPISWIMIDEKLDCHDYWDLDDFKVRCMKHVLRRTKLWV